MKRLRLKDLGTFKTGLTYSPDNICEPNEGVLVLRSANIQDDILDLGDCVYVNNDIPSWMRVKKGDILICSRNGSANLVGKTAIINSDINATWGAFMMLLRTRYNSNYINYLLNIVIRREKARFSTSTINQLTNSMLGGIVVDIFEDAKEQQRIVEYLDAKTTEIDKKIELLGKKRDAYNRLKTATINRAVTRGLNEHVKLKDSGVDWISEIPEHWEVKRFKSIFTECKDVSTTGTEDLLSVSEYYGIARRTDKMEDGEYETRAESLVGYKLCQKGDLVINIMLAWKRGLGISDYNGIVSPSYAVYRGRRIIPHYFHYLMRTDKYIAEYKRNSTGIIDSRLRLYTDKFNAIKAIVPPLSEQKQIAAYLDERCAKIDKAVTIIDKQIDALKRLKRSLINEVVTGKRMV